MRRYIPADIIAEILGVYLKDDRDTLLSCHLVSKIWSQVSAPLLYRKLKVSMLRGTSAGKSRTMDDVHNFLVFRPHLSYAIQNLTLHDKTPLTQELQWNADADVLWLILRLLPKLQHLTLYNIFLDQPVANNGLPDILRPSLRTLIVVFSQRPPKSQLDTFSDVLKMFSSIDELSLNEPTYPDYRGNSQETAGPVPTIYSLTLVRHSSFSLSSRNTPRRLRWLTSVRKLKLSYIDWEEIGTISAVVRDMVALEELEIQYAHFMGRSDEAAHDPLSTLDLSQCTKLKHVSASFRVTSGFHLIAWAVRNGILSPLNRSRDTSSLTYAPLHLTLSLNVQDLLNRNGAEQCATQFKDCVISTGLLGDLRTALQSGCVRKISVCIYASGADADTKGPALAVLRSVLPDLMPVPFYNGVLVVN